MTAQQTTFAEVFAKRSAKFDDRYWRMDGRGIGLLWGFAYWYTECLIYTRVADVVDGPRPR